MISLRWKTASLACASSLALSACTASLYSEAIGDYSEAQKESSGVILDHISIYERSLRVVRQEKQIGAGTAVHVADFANFVCSGRGEFSKQRRATAGQALYGAQLQAFVKSPTGLGDTLGSIIRYLEPVAPLKSPEESAQYQFDICKADVKFLVGLAPESFERQGGFGIAAIGNLQSIVKALEVVLGIVEDYLRGYRIRQYILASDPAIRESFKDMNTEDNIATDLCKRHDNDLNAIAGGDAEMLKKLKTFSPLCEDVDAEHPATAFDRLTIVEQWASLREAWHRYEQVCAAAGLCPRGATPAMDHIAAQEQLAKVEKALNAYVTLLGAPSPKRAASDLQDVYEKGLWRLANGELTIEEILGLLNAFKERYEAASAALKTIAAGGKS